MAFLLQCLRDIRTWTGELDLLPPAVGQSLGKHLLLRSCAVASSQSGCDEASIILGGNAENFAREIHRDVSTVLALNPSSFAAASPLEPA